MSRLFARALTLTLLLAMICTAAGAGAQSQKPISLRGLAEALRINGLTVDELIEHVRRRGVDFELTAEAERVLRDAGARPELLAAVRDNRRSARGLGVTEAPAARPPIPAGSYHALVIGNNAYEAMPRLKTAERDAQAVAAALREKYGFETRLLLNATRQQLISSVTSYRRQLGADANLLIYYAGHGYNDREADKGYWLPVDARLDDTGNWISADDITTSAKVIPARHLLIISDSCYSGTIYRGIEPTLSTPFARERFLEKMSLSKSRTLMASGGNEPVADGGGGGHSVFARALLDGLDRMEADAFTAAELFHDYVQERVAGGAEQTPEYNPLRNSGHEGGDFVFIRAKPGDKRPPAAPNANPVAPTADQRPAPAAATGPLAYKNMMTIVGPFTVELRSCEAEGADVVCQLMVNNAASGASKEFNLCHADYRARRRGLDVSKALDASGGEYALTESLLGASKITGASCNRAVLAPQVPLKLSVRFANVARESGSFSLMRLSVAEQTNMVKPSYADFKNVPIKR